MLWDPMDCNTPGSPVLYLPKLAQIHVRWISDAIQPSHPLLLPSPFAFNLSQHQGLFQWVGSSHQVAKVLELRHQEIETMKKYVGRCFVPDSCVFPDRDLWSYLTVFILWGCESVGWFWYFPLDSTHTSVPHLIFSFRDKWYPENSWVDNLDTGSSFWKLKSLPVIDKRIDKRDRIGNPKIGLYKHSWLVFDKGQSNLVEETYTFSTSDAGAIGHAYAQKWTWTQTLHLIQKLTENESYI